MADGATTPKRSKFGAVGRLGGQVKRLGSGMKKHTQKAAGAVWSVGTTAAAGLSVGHSSFVNGVEGSDAGGRVGGCADEDDEERDQRVMELFRTLRLQGGSPHSSLLVAVAKGALVTSTPVDPSLSTPSVSSELASSATSPLVGLNWFRIGKNEEFEPLAHVHGSTYQASADDIGQRVAAQCFDVRNPAVCRFTEVGPLIPGGELVSAVDAALKDCRLALPQVLLRVQASAGLRAVPPGSGSSSASPANNAFDGSGSMGDPFAPTTTVVSESSLAPPSSSSSSLLKDGGATFDAFNDGDNGFLTLPPAESNGSSSSFGANSKGNDEAAAVAKLPVHEVSLELSTAGLKLMACESDTPRGLFFSFDKLVAKGKLKPSCATAVTARDESDNEHDDKQPKNSASDDTAWRPCTVVLHPSDPTRVDVVFSGGARAVRDCMSWFGDTGGELWGYMALQRAAADAVRFEEGGADQHEAAMTKAVEGLQRQKPSAPSSSASNESRSDELITRAGNGLEPMEFKPPSQSGGPPFDEFSDDEGYAAEGSLEAATAKFFEAKAFDPFAETAGRSSSSSNNDSNSDVREAGAPLAGGAWHSGTESGAGQGTIARRERSSLRPPTPTVEEGKHDDEEGGGGVDLIKDGGMGESGTGREPNAASGTNEEQQHDLLGLDVVTATADSHASSDSSAKVPGQESGYFDSLPSSTVLTGMELSASSAQLAHDDSMQSAAGGGGLQRSSIGSSSGTGLTLHFEVPDPHSRDILAVVLRAFAAHVGALLPTVLGSFNSGSFNANAALVDDAVSMSPRTWDVPWRELQLSGALNPMASMQLAVDELKTEVALRTDEAAQAKETATIASARVRTLEGTNVDLSSKLKQFEAMLEDTRSKAEAEAQQKAERVTALEKLAADAATEANVAQAAAAAAQAKEATAVGEAEKRCAEMSAELEPLRMELERLRREQGHWKRKAESLRKECERGARAEERCQQQAKQLQDAAGQNEELKAAIEIARQEGAAYKQALEHALTVSGSSEGLLCEVIFFVEKFEY